MIECYAVVIGDPPKQIPHIVVFGGILSVFSSYVEAREFAKEVVPTRGQKAARVVLLREVKK
jgi:hypothetical protein